MTRFVPASLLAAALAASGAAAAPTGGDSAAGASCDRLAAFNDGTADAPPVRLAEMNAEAAASACRAALGGAAPAPRHHLQLARALIKLGRVDEARRQLARAMERDHASAYYVLGQLHHAGHGVAEDKDRAYALYRKALSGGYREAALGLLMLFEDPESGYFDPVRAEAARRIFEGRGRP